VARERVKGQAKAINWRNFFSVGHTLLELVIRRVSRATRRRK
jgi:hypothetical protein